VRLKLTIQILLEVKKVPGFITYIQAFVTKAHYSSTRICVCVSHDSHKKIHLYYCDTDPARNASTTCKFVNTFGMKTGGMRPSASFLYLASFTLSTNSTFQWYMSSGVTRVTYKNYGIKLSSIQVLIQRVTVWICSLYMKTNLNSSVTELRYVNAVWSRDCQQKTYVNWLKCQEMNLRTKCTLKYSKVMMINSWVPELIATVNNNSRVTESFKMTLKSFVLQSEITES